MLDNTEYQRLRDRIAEVAPLIPGPVAESTTPHQGHAGAPACQPFSKDKVQRILDRVYNWLADEAAECVEPRLRELIAEVASHLETAYPPLSAEKVQRILDRVQAHLAAEETKGRPVRTELPRSTGQKAAAWASLRTVAAALRAARGHQA